VQRLFCRLEQCGDIDRAGRAEVGLLEDIRDALVRRGEAAGLRNGEEFRTDTPPFTDEQKEYLQGFLSGAGAARQALGMPPLPTLPLANGNGQASNGHAVEGAPTGPDAVHFEAQNRFLAAGKKLTAEDKAKREGHPFDMWDQITANAKAGVFPKGTDVFKYKYYGLFQTAPNQNAFMSRLKLPNGILNAWQMRGLADLKSIQGHIS
jgi:ferredoxin-nitrite reductase